MDDDDLDMMGIPNCPDCLTSMESTVNAWWCQGCERIVRLEDDEKRPAPSS